MPFSLFTDSKSKQHNLKVIGEIDIYTDGYETNWVTPVLQC